MVRFRPQVHTVWSRPHQHIWTKHLGRFGKVLRLNFLHLWFTWSWIHWAVSSWFENTKVIFLPKLLLIFLWKFARVSCNPAISNMWHQSDKQKPCVDFSTHQWMNQSLTVHVSTSLCGSPNICLRYLPWVDTVTSAFTLEAVGRNQPSCLTSEGPEQWF